MAKPSNRRTVTGIIETIKYEQNKPFMPSYYSPNEQYDLCLNVCLRLDDGKACYFRTVSGRRSIATASAVAIDMYFFDGESAKWMEETGDNNVATPYNPSNASWTAKVRVGQRITISGSVKADTVSRLGKPYIALNRVRLEKIED
jgi:hypothetical protein